MADLSRNLEGASSARGHRMSTSRRFFLFWHVTTGSLLTRKPVKDKQDSQENRQRTANRQADTQVSVGSKPGTPGETGQIMETLKEVMTLREASQYLGISPDTLYKYLSQDRIPAFKLGNRWRFKKDLLDRWMEKKSERPQDWRPKQVVKSTVKVKG